MKNSNYSKNRLSLSEWLFYLKNLHDKVIDMDLNRVSEVAARLNLLTKPAPFIFTVTGTNGKGTTCCTLEMILIAAGYKVGIYNSPHLINYTERIRVQNKELSVAEHISSFLEIESVRNGITLTYFEYSTLSALWLFKSKKLDVVILEVGLGGRLDATNIIDSDVAVVTNIALDHTDWLGSDRESIGREKAGIFRANKPVIIGEYDIPEILIQLAKEKGSKLIRRDVDWRFIIQDKTWFYEDNRGNLLNLPIPHVSISNVATALASLRASSLKVSEVAIREGIQNTILPGRFQIVSKSPYLILDVAHNPHAAAHLADRLKSIPKISRVLAVISMLQNKNIIDTISSMSTVVNNWYLAPLDIPCGASIELLSKCLGKKRGKCYKNIVKAWQAAMVDALPEDAVVVFGSFYTVSNIMKYINLSRQS